MSSLKLILNEQERLEACKGVVLATKKGDVPYARSLGVAYDVSAPSVSYSKRLPQRIVLAVEQQVPGAKVSRVIAEVDEQGAVHLDAILRLN